MMRNPSALTAPMLVLLALSTACSSQQDSSAAPPERPQVFSAKDKRAARVLSISNNQAVLDAPSPYARALLCMNAIESLAKRFQHAKGPMLTEQQATMQQARAHFKEQLLVLVQREGKASGELSRDLGDVAKRHANAGENAQIAIACLRRIQEAG